MSKVKRTKKKQSDDNEEESGSKQEVSEIDKVISQVKKSKGDQAILNGSSMPISNHIPTGSFMLDFGLLGGVAEGYATMLYGVESSGKTAIAKKIAGQFQKKYPDKKVAWVDVEGMFDADWATKLGANTDDMVVSRPETGQEAVDVMEAMMHPVEVGLVVLDSIPACTPYKVLDKSSEDLTMGELARLMGIMCSKIIMAWNKERKRNHWVTVILMNQYRYKIGVMFGDPRTLPGGRQINHMPSTKVELKNKEVMGVDRHNNEVVEYNEHEFKLTKTKHGSSIKQGQFKLTINPDNEKGYNTGQCMDTTTVCTYAKKMGLVTGGGSNWRIEGVDEKFRTLADIEQYLFDNEDVYVWLKKAIIGMQREEKGLPRIPPDGFLLDWTE